MTDQRDALRDDVYLNIASQVARLGTCARRKVGAVAIDANGKVLGTGFNGSPKGYAHCIDQPCAAAGAPSGTDLDRCEAIHAETNLVGWCDTMQIHTVYLTCAPCRVCIKMLANTSCQRIVFREPYAHSDSEEFWLRMPGRTWECVPDQEAK